MSSRHRKFPLPGAIAFLGSISLLLGWPWSTDMIRQPAILPYQGLFLPPEGSVPVGGEEVLPRDAIAARFTNPAPMNPDSIERGRKMFHTYCSPCHGEEGKGHGTVAQGEFQPPDLTAGKIPGLSDATIYGTITDGWLTMPLYREAMSIGERWDTVNYVRVLQGKR